MPTYEYRCPSGHQYEKREGFDAPARQKCEQCGKQATRLLFAPPVVFKGSGFYKTDNRGSSGAESSSSESSSGSSSTSASGTEEKPAAKAADNGHGHSHGPGGHTHGETAPAPAAKSSDSVESAAAS